METDVTPPDDDLLAGEFVLGVLGADARRAVAQRRDGDARFAALVAGWERRLSPLLMQPEPVVPSPQVWTSIISTLDRQTLRPVRGGVWNSVGFWRAATGMAAAAAVAAFVIGLRQPGPAAVAPVPVVQVPANGEQAAKPVVVLARDDGRTGWLATIDSARHALLMVPVPTAADATGLVDELWLIAPGQAPRSLGLVSNDKAHTVQVPADLQPALAVGATLAVTLEPRAGMPHAGPSGPIVAKGEIARI